MRKYYAVILIQTHPTMNPANRSSMLDQPVGHAFPSSGVESLPPSQRVHLVLLGVEDVARSTRFFEQLGWSKSPAGNEGFAKFDMGGYAICLINRADFARDALQATLEGSGFAGVALIHLANTPEEVPRILARAVEAGGTLVKPATRTHWGIAGYFKDPDGHLFEVDYEHAWVFDQDHRLVVDQVNT
jgi:hypothetical protein